MRLKKIRGHNRIHKQIDTWRLENLSINLNNHLLKDGDMLYALIKLQLWSIYFMTSGRAPEPKGKTKQKMINGLIDIYENWKIQLDKIGKPYSLKVWLFEPRFSESKVMCAIGDKVDAYINDYFFKPAIPKRLNTNNYGLMKNRLENLNWEYYLDEFLSDSDVGETEFYSSGQKYQNLKKFHDKLLKKLHRRMVIKFIGEDKEYFAFKRGEIWIM